MSGDVESPTKGIRCMAVTDPSALGVVRMPDEPTDAELIERSREEPERSR
jgi:hypothetical protein